MEEQAEHNERQNSKTGNENCPVEAALKRIGGKWKVLIILRLLVRTCRFNELLRSLNGCTQRMLTNQLRELERDGIVHREVYHQVPPKVEYSLTPAGKELKPILGTMCEWGQVHVQGRKPDQKQAIETVKSLFDN